MFFANSYRFGFNGKENDNEVKGEGVQQNYGLRIYDTRLGRFLSVDPLAKDYPWYTPYQFSGNKPIQFIDLDGAEEAAPMKNSEATMTGYTSAQDNARGGYGGKSVNEKFVVETTIKLPTNNGTITPTPSAWQQEFDKSVAPETRNMVTIDPVFRAVSTGSLIYTGAVAVTATAETVVASKTAIASTGANTIIKIAEFGAKAECYYSNSLAAQRMVGALYGAALSFLEKGQDPEATPSLSSVPAEITSQFTQGIISLYKQMNTPTTESVPAQNNTKAITYSYTSSKQKTSNNSSIPYKNVTPYTKPSLLSTF